MIPKAKITPFGDAVRKARLDLGTSLLVMSKELEVTPAFLSGMEVSRTEIPLEWAQKIEDYFAAKGYAIPNLKMLACVSNQAVSLKNMPMQQQVLVALLATQTPTEEQMYELETQLSKVLRLRAIEDKPLTFEQALARNLKRYESVLKKMEDM